MWFGKAVQDFNSFIVSQGKNGPELIANLGNGFTSRLPTPKLVAILIWL